MARSRILGNGLLAAYSATPTTPVAGYTGWWKADALSLSDGDAVATWTATTGTNFTQGTAGQKPTYKTNIVNGKPVVRFDGGDRMVATGFNGGARPTFFFVIIPSSTSPIGFFDSAPWSAHVARNYTAGVWEWWSNAPNTSLGLANTNPVVLTFKMNESGGTRTVTYRKNGTQISANTASNSNTVAWANPEVGSINNGGTAYYTGDIAEILIYNSILSDADCASTEAYLKAKYGMT